MQIIYFVDSLSSFAKYVLQERVDEVVDTPPYLVFGNPVYGERFLQEVNKVNLGNFWQPLCFAAEVVRLARLDPRVPHVCRGSAGSSLLCYLAGISDVDPVRYAIPVERFLGGGRGHDKPPDIDLDFPSNLRSVVWERIRARFGDRVAFVATKLRYRSRSALREALRRSGISYNVWVSQSAVVSEAQRERVMSLAKSLEGRTYGISRHCGGLVFFPSGQPPADFCSAREKNPFIQLILDKGDLEKRSLGKLDVLSNNALLHLSSFFHLDCGKPWGDICQDLDDTINSKVGQLFSTGNTWGIIQAESPAMRKLLMKLKISSLEGVVLALGLVRPAVSCKASGRNLDCSTNLNPTGRNPLERMLIYEDDVTEFLSVILDGSFSLAEYSRRVLAKGGKEARDLLREVGRVVNRKGREKVIFRGRQWTWEQIKKQLGLASAYSFCKAHAMAYGRLVWSLGVAKVSNPRMFWQSFLNTGMPSSMYLPWVYFERIKSELGVNVVWPGDLGISKSRYLSVPWLIGSNYAMPSIAGIGTSGTSVTSGGFGVFEESKDKLVYGDCFSKVLEFDGELWKRQLLSAGFWSGSAGLIPETYLVPSPNLKFGEVMFKGLKALKSARVHFLEDGSVCLFQTLGFGRSSVLESSHVCSKQSLLKLQEASKLPSLNSYENHQLSSFYLKSSPFVSGLGKVTEKDLSSLDSSGKVIYLKC